MRGCVCAWPCLSCGVYTAWLQPRSRQGEFLLTAVVYYYHLVARLRVLLAREVVVALPLAALRDLEEQRGACLREVSLI